MKKPSSGGNVKGIGLEGSKTLVGILCLYKTPNLHGLILGEKLPGLILGEKLQVGGVLT